MTCRCFGAIDPKMQTVYVTQILQDPRSALLRTGDIRANIETGLTVAMQDPDAAWVYLARLLNVDPDAVILVARRMLEKGPDGLPIFASRTYIGDEAAQEVVNAIRRRLEPLPPLDVYGRRMKSITPRQARDKEHALRLWRDGYIPSDVAKTPVVMAPGATVQHPIYGVGTVIKVIRLEKHLRDGTVVDDSRVIVGFSGPKPTYNRAIEVDGKTEMVAVNPGPSWPNLQVHISKLTLIA